MKTFHVVEPHLAGTHTFQPGDTREADEHDVQHLVALGVLSTEKPKPARAAKAKADGAADQNKAEGAADQNKAEVAADQNKAG